MTKRHVLLLTAVLGMASAPTALAQTAPLTNSPVTVAAADTQLSNASITIETGTYNGPLSSLLGAIAKTAGYGLILDTNVDALQGTVAPAASATGPTAAAPTDTGRPLVYSFKDKPFNQVWPLLMDVYGLSYEVIQVGGQPVLRVGNSPIQRIVNLKNADATEAANQVKLFFGTPTYSETPQKDAQGNVIGTIRTLADVKIDSPTLRVVPDVRSNSVIVRGTNKEVAEVTSLLGQLDQTGGVPTKDATPTAGSQNVQRVYAVKGAQADIVALLAAQYPGLKVTPVGQTGQLVITGPLNQLDAATTLLGQVDKPAAATPTGPQTVQKVFQLVNASAEEVKATLEGTLARDLNQGTLVPNATLIDPSTGQPYTTGPLANAPLTPATATLTAAATPTTASTAATIIADKRTNTVIVRGTQVQVNQVAELIPQLDKVVPQINVQVRIQEITQQATRSLGLDWAVNFGGFKVKLGSAGVGATFDPTQSLMGFNIFPTLNALETQNLAKKVYDGSISMQSGQRALAGNGLTANVSSTAAASIKSGGRLEVSIPSSAANVAAIQRQIDYGVNLDFFDPQVAPDGSITLRVRGQVNDLTTKIPDNGVGVPNILQFTNSEAQSVVTFKSGQTLLLTGLMGNKSTESNKGVPYLSSIPVIGAAFGSQTYDKAATQLLVVITGTVVQ